MTKDLVFFALLRDLEGSALRTLRIDRQAQVMLTELFRIQALDFPKGADIVSYSPDYRGDEGELLEIEKFELPENIERALASPDRIHDLEASALINLPVRALVAVESPTRKNRELYFQSFDGRQILGRKPSLIFSGDTFTQLKEPGIALKDRLSATLIGDRLIFESEEIARRFLDLDQYFQEATNEDVKTFLEHRAFIVEDEQAIFKSLDRWTRKKVSSIQARDLLKTVDLGKLKAVGDRFKIPFDVQTVNGKPRVVVPSSKQDLKRFIRLLAQDYLDCPITGDSFQVSSKRRIA